MAQTAQILKGDPAKVKSELETLISGGNTIIDIQKTFSSGSYLVVVDNVAGGQSVSLFKGDPDSVADQITNLAATIHVVSDTFSASQFLVVWV